jgi:hypothetical protein
MTKPKPALVVKTGPKGKQPAPAAKPKPAVKAKSKPAVWQRRSQQRR